MHSPRSELKVAFGLLLVGASSYSALKHLLLLSSSTWHTGGSDVSALFTALLFVLGAFVAANGLFWGIRDATTAE